jgi:hypothetical protein
MASTTYANRSKKSVLKLNLLVMFPFTTLTGRELDNSILRTSDCCQGVQDYVLLDEGIGRLCTSANIIALWWGTPAGFS